MATEDRETLGRRQAVLWQALRVTIIALQVVGPHRQYRMRCDCYRCSRNCQFRY